MTRAGFLQSVVFFCVSGAVGCAHAVAGPDDNGYGAGAAGGGSLSPDAGFVDAAPSGSPRDANTTVADGSVEVRPPEGPRDDATADAAGALASADADSDADDDAEDQGNAGSNGDAMGAAIDSSPPDTEAGSPPPRSGVSPGDLLVTEVMFDPSGDIPESQWFEIYNATDSPVHLDGLAIGDGSGRRHVIASGGTAVVPAHAYVVLVRDWATALYDSIPLDSIAYEYGAGLTDEEGIELAADAAGALSLWAGSALVVVVPYGPWNFGSLGQSIELAELLAEGSDQASGWCLAQSPWAFGSDYGTPGWPSDCF